MSLFIKRFLSKFVFYFLSFYGSHLERLSHIFWGLAYLRLPDSLPLLWVPAGEVHQLRQAAHPLHHQQPRLTVRHPGKKEAGSFKVQRSWSKKKAMYLYWICLGSPLPPRLWQNKVCPITPCFRFCNFYFVTLYFSYINEERIDTFVLLNHWQVNLLLSFERIELPRYAVLGSSPPDPSPTITLVCC